MAKKILVVDDDRAALRLTKMHLEKEGYQVVFAADGLSCMSAVREENPDLIVLDLGLPVGDGFTTLSRLRENLSLSHIPVLVLTGLDSPNAEQKAREFGARGFFEKSGDPQELVTEIRRQLGTSPGA